MNANCIQWKWDQFKTAVQYVNPNINIVTESNLCSDVIGSEVFPEECIPYRNDRKRGRGGDLLPSNPVAPRQRLAPAPEEGTSEEVWAPLALNGAKDLFVWSFYKPSSTNDSLFSELRDLLSNAFQIRDKKVILRGDFNARGINWKSQTVIDNCDNPKMREDLIQMANDAGLLQ